MRVCWRRAFEASALVVALGFVFLVTFLPHLSTFENPPDEEQPALVRLAMTGLQAANGTRDVYPYAIHLDEHVHWVYGSALVRQERVVLDYPYTGDPAKKDAFFSLRGAVHERGFHLVVAEIAEVTGISMFRIFEFLPAIWLTFTAFGVYAALRPHPAAIPAAAFVALVPTTLRFLGPGFLVPIGFVLAWVPAGLILAEPAKRFAGGAALLALVVVWAFFIHLIGGFAVVGLLAIGGLLGGAKNLRSAMTLVVITAVPVLWLYNTFTGDVQFELEREESLPIDFTAFDNLGVPALLVWAGSVALYAFQPPHRRSMPMTAFVGGSAAIFGLIISGVALDWGRYATYGRWHPPFFLAAAVPLGFAVATAATASHRALVTVLRRQPKLHRAAPAVAIFVGLAVSAFLVSPGVNQHIKEPYYRVIDDETWERYTFIMDNVGPEYQVFLAHPWQAPVLLALSGKYPYSRMLPGAPPVNGEAYDEYARTGGSIGFYIMKDISLVVATGKPPIPEFINLGHEGVWGLRPEVAEQLAEIRDAERARS